MSKRRSHWLHAGLTFVLTILAAGILLPLVRAQPEVVHQYIHGLRDWIRISFVFSLCAIFTGIMFKLLSPRVGHLSHLRASPPAWLAAMLAWLVVAIVDVLQGFESDGYHATLGEWLFYAGGSLLVVGWFSGLWSECACWIETKYQCHPKEESANPITLQDIENAPWEEIEKWLQSDAQAEYDFIGNQSVAHRVSLRISEGTRSVGIVGPFGAGKTSIVTWVIERLKRHEVGGKRYFVCRHSCWGFETSASAIHDMLGTAVSELSNEIDTFEIDSLPDSYRKTFSAGGDWVETISNLVLRSLNPHEQFSRLSDLLECIGGWLVFIVEDLDRNDTRTFEIQEILAFLERLKEYPNFSFILTGGRSSTRHIDYAKLCDQIEVLKTIEPRHTSPLIYRVIDRCLDSTLFPHFHIGDPNRNHVWHPMNGVLMREYEEFSFAQAVAILLDTPRSLRHAIGRTYSAWHFLHGEIDFNDLLALNVLKFGAPESFHFLVRRWDRLSSYPSRAPYLGKSRIDGIRRAIMNDWNRTIENVDWNDTVALQVIKFVLPATEYWIEDKKKHGHIESGRQQITERRYWLRAVNEAIEKEDVLDQEIIRDVHAWLGAPAVSAELVTKLTSSPRYGDIWEILAGNLLADRRQIILLLCEHVLQRLLQDYGASACSDSPGFAHTWRFANRRVGHDPDNHNWIRDRITESSRVSLEMVNVLWNYYGSGSYSILSIQDRKSARQCIYDSVKREIRDGSSLVARLSSNTSNTVFQLVFDPSGDAGKLLADVPTWSWLGAIILDAMRSKDLTAVSNCGILLSARVDRSTIKVDTEVLDLFFGDTANEVIRILDLMQDQLPTGDRRIVRTMISAAREYLH